MHDYTSIILFTLSLFALFFSIMVISTSSPINSILYLIITFCFVAFMFILLQLEFLAVTLLIVYVGAIAVLFLFVVMMLNIKIIELDERFWKILPLGFFSCALFFSSIASLLFKNEISSLLFTSNLQYKLKILENSFAIIEINTSTFDTFNSISNTELIGYLVYSYNMLTFFVLGLILLVAMIGTIVLVLNQNINLKRQLIFKQNHNNLKNAILLKK